LSNAVANPGYEYWDDFGPSGPPDGWLFEPSGLTTATQESEIVYEGNYSAKLWWTSTSTQEFKQFVPVVGGELYDMSIYYYDNDPNGQIRLYCYWLDSEDQVIGTAISSPYSSDNAAWFKFEILDLVAPVDAVTFEFCVRMYDISGWIGSASVYVDKAELCGMIPASPTPTMVPTEPPTPEPTATNTPEPTSTNTPEPTMTFTPEPTATGTPIVCLHDGDVNGDGTVTPGDAQSAFMFYLNCAELNPDHIQYCSADFCGTGSIAPCDGSVTPADAQGIMREYLGYAVPCTKRASASGITSARGLLKLENASAAHQGEFVVGVMGTGNPAPVSAIGLELTYDPAEITFVSAERGTANPGWFLFGGHETKPGTVRIGAVSLNSLPVGSEGSLAMLRFTVKSLDVQTTVPTIALGALTDDLAGWEVQALR